MTHYLAGAIDLSRAAELLQTPALDLRTRFLRLDVPFRGQPAGVGEVPSDGANSASWLAEG